MRIKSEVLNWLLEEENPSVRYRTLTELLGEDRDDPKVQDAKAKIAANKSVQYIFSKMHPDGYWEYNGKGAGLDYLTSVTTHFNLAFLAELGMDSSDERIERAVERYLKLQKEDGDFLNYQACLYAYNLRSFIMLGFRQHPGVQKIAELMCSRARPDGGYLCRGKENKRKTRAVKSCIRGSTKALMAFAILPELWQHPRCLELADYFLRRRVIFRTTDPEKYVNSGSVCTTFPFDWRNSIIETAYALSVMGYGKHKALGPMWEVLERKKDSNGRYILDWNPPKAYFKPGRRGQANKWVTLYAYLALSRKNG